MNPSSDEPESDVQPQNGPQEPTRWQFSLGALFELTAGVAVACSLFTWWGLGGVAAMLGAAARAFGGAMVCPRIGFGFDRVLDKPGPDLLRCLGVGAYVAGGIWVANVVFPVFTPARRLEPPARLLLGRVAGLLCAHGNLRCQGPLAGYRSPESGDRRRRSGHRPGCNAFAVRVDT